jgi:tetratricopeptide (TPR) repeat protein
MYRIKTGLLLFALFVMKTTQSQTLEEGKKMLYYERYQSARNIFQKLIEANPQQVEAVYYLGQCMILPDESTSKDLAEAKSLYQSKLQATNNPLLIAGIGHIELLQGNATEARRQFDAAANLTEKKNLMVLNAIGFANSNPDTKNGDAAYAISMLGQAKTLKKFNDPDVLVNLGDAYRKNGDGGNAVLSYEAALAINPKYARANYRIGRLYETQGRGQESIFMEHYNKAIASDEDYAPVYAALFNYYYETDISKAAEYFEKWLAHSDTDAKSCYYKTAIKYAQGYFLEAISSADECISKEGENPYPNLFGVKANAYNRLKDSVNAVVNFEAYLSRQKPEKITSGDCLEYAKNLSKVGGKDSLAIVYVEKAIEMESQENAKLNIAKSFAQSYEAKKNFKEAARWYSRMLALKSNPGKVDLYNAGYNFYRAANYDSAISVFTTYSSKFPDDIFGYFMSGKASWAIDTTLQLGMATPYFEKTIQLGLTDTVKNKAQLITAYKYYVSLAAMVKKDRQLTMDYIDKILALDPNDTEAAKNKAILSQPAQAPKKKPTSGRP